jgi:hypothetical protein
LEEYVPEKREQYGYIDMLMELIDIDNDEDKDKAMYYNYMKLLK